MTTTMTTTTAKNVNAATVSTRLAKAGFENSKTNFGGFITENVDERGFVPNYTIVSLEADCFGLRNFGKFNEDNAVLLNAMKTELEKYGYAVEYVVPTNDNGLHYLTVRSETPEVSFAKRTLRQAQIKLADAQAEIDHAMAVIAGA